MCVSVCVGVIWCVCILVCVCVLCVCVCVCVCAWMSACMISQLCCLLLAIACAFVLVIAQFSCLFQIVALICLFLLSLLLLWFVCSSLLLVGCNCCVFTRNYITIDSDKSAICPFLGVCVCVRVCVCDMIHLESTYDTPWHLSHIYLNLVTHMDRPFWGAMSHVTDIDAWYHT